MRKTLTQKNSKCDMDLEMRDVKECSPHDNLLVFGTKFNFILSERLKRRANIPIQNKAK